MVIERLTYKNGAVVENLEDSAGAIQQLLIRDEDAIKILSEGEYDITPTLWTRHLSTYRLLVHANGTGTLRMLPRFNDVVVTELSSQGISQKAGGKVQNLPQDAQTATIAGPKFDDPRIRIYEIIRFTPGSNPRQ